MLHPHANCSQYQQQTLILGATALFPNNIVYVTPSEPWRYLAGSVSNRILCSRHNGSSLWPLPPHIVVSNNSALILVHPLPLALPLEGLVQGKQTFVPKVKASTWTLVEVSFSFKPCAWYGRLRYAPPATMAKIHDAPKFEKDGSQEFSEVHRARNGKGANPKHPKPNEIPQFTKDPGLD